MAYGEGNSGYFDCPNCDIFYKGDDCPLCIVDDLAFDLLEACIPFANKATLYLLADLTYRCACCNAEPQNVSACDFEHRSDCPVTKAREAIAKAENENNDS